MLYNLPINIINIIYMENKSKLKYYWLGLIILIVIVVVVMLSRNSESVTQQSQAQNTTNTSTTNTVATKTNPISTSGLIGTWVSSVPKKGMQGPERVRLMEQITKLILPAISIWLCRKWKTMLAPEQ